ncbi:ribose-5-phosphate isomerase RpiA [uncultured Maricaulis sp.]|jgi:ribose 5-phosphate isomerase A|uniref:ribose-5-phosphate isomerase RpiA n=1 Tax=uncultured Maricaulis sp. TaxID=174710 RepID=UPI0030DBB333
MSAERQKTLAAAAALDYVESGMTLGLGSGSTAEIFLRLLGEKVRDGLDVRGVPTSQRTAEVAVEHGVPLIDVDHVDHIAITIDGADEVDGRFQLIKGGGACLLREKIIAHASDLMIVMVDETKLVSTLGKFPLPVEVDRFGFSLTASQVYEALRKAGVASPDVQLRRKGDGLEPLITDGGHYILDCACQAIPDARAVDQVLKAIPGVVEHGLFINLARVVIVGEDGEARVMEL